MSIQRPSWFDIVIKQHYPLYFYMLETRLNVFDSDIIRKDKLIRSTGRFFNCFNLIYLYDHCILHVIFIAASIVDLFTADGAQPNL